MQKEVDAWAHQFEKTYFSQLSMISTCKHYVWC